MEHLNSTQIYNNKLGTQHLNSTQKNKILKTKNDLLKHEKDFRNGKDKEIKIKKKKKMEDLFKKPVLLPRPKKTFHQKSTPLLGLRKL